MREMEGIRQRTIITNKDLFDKGLYSIKGKPVVYDLMTGNFTSVYDRKKIFHHCYTLEGEEVSAYIDNKGTKCAPVKPLKLTDEMLIANGFEYDGQEWFIYSSLKPCLGYYVHKSKKGYQIGSISQIDSVHHFQDILKVCYLSELAMNFKLNNECLTSKNKKVMSSSIIDEIRRSREAIIPEEKKAELLEYIKHKMLTSDSCVINGAAHYERQEWGYHDGHLNRAPYGYHAAISQWLRSLGFHTSRYINNLGVDNGLKVSI